MTFRHNHYVRNDGGLSLRSGFNFPDIFALGAWVNYGKTTVPIHITGRKSRYFIPLKGVTLFKQLFWVFFGVI